MPQRWRTWGGVTAGAGLAVSAVLVLRSGALNGLATAPVTPFLGAGQGGGRALAELTGGWLAERRALRARVHELERQVQDLELELAGLRELRRENRELRQDIGLAVAPEWRVTPVRVLARDPADWNRRFRIAAGRQHGVREGSPVVAGGGLVGRVSSVGGTSAVVLTLADPGCRVSVRMRGTDAVGILRGRRRVRWREPPSALLDYLPRDEAYRHGVAVETSGLGNEVPGGITVGHVEIWDESTGEVARLADGAYAQVLIRPAADFDLRGHVAVLLRVDR